MSDEVRTEATAVEAPRRTKVKLTTDIECGGAEFAAGDVIELVEFEGNLCWHDPVEGVHWNIEASTYGVVDEAVEAATSDESATVVSETEAASSETNGQVSETPTPNDVAETPAGETFAVVDPAILFSPPVDPAEAVAKDREAAFRAELRAAELAVEAAECEVDDLKAALKSAKEEYEERVSFLRGLVRGMDNDKSRPLLNAQPSGESGNTENARENGTSPEITSSPAAPNPDAWRSAPLAELGLKPKLTERLVEAGYPTIGKLVDLRAAIAIGHEKWPKGIGAAKITEIENAEIDWLGKNRETWGQPAAVVVTVVGLVPQPADQPATDGVDLPSDPPAGDSAAEMPDPDMPTPCDWEAIGDWEAMSESARTRWIEDRMEALSQESDTQPRLIGASYWDQGYAACEANEPEPPFSPSPALDDWLRGWLSCEAVTADIECGYADAPSTATPEPEPVAAGVSLVSIDDL